MLGTCAWQCEEQALPWCHCWRALMLQRHPLRLGADLCSSRGSLSSNSCWALLSMPRRSATACHASRGRRPELACSTALPPGTVSRLGQLWARWGSQACLQRFWGQFLAVALHNCGHDLQHQCFCMGAYPCHPWPAMTLLKHWAMLLVVPVSSKVPSKSKTTAFTGQVMADWLKSNFEWSQISQRDDAGTASPIDKSDHQVSS